MSNFEFDASDFLVHLDTKDKNTERNARVAIQDSLDDLKRISSEVAPIKDSTLRKSVKTKVNDDPLGISGEVSFSAIEKHGNKSFNYAYWIHEEDYNLGERSANAPGTDGYHVGNKYLERPLKGESERYIKEWAERIAGGLD